MTLPELFRRLENLLRVGTVEEVNGTRCRVKTGDLVTGWLPWFTQRAGNDVDWWPLEVGEQVMVLSPGGELAAGYVLAGIYSTQKASPSTDPDQRVIRFEDGTTLIYDKAHHKLSAYVKGDVELFADGSLLADLEGSAVITATGNINANTTGNLTAQASSASVNATSITLNGQVQVNGPLTLAGPLNMAPGSAGGGAVLQGDMEIQGNIINNGINIGSTHIHPRNDGSGGNTGTPQ